RSMFKYLGFVARIAWFYSYIEPTEEKNYLVKLQLLLKAHVWPEIFEKAWSRGRNLFEALGRTVLVPMDFDERTCRGKTPPPVIPSMQRAIQTDVLPRQTQQTKTSHKE